MTWALRNGAYGIVMRGVLKCTCAGASLRDRNPAPLCCIKLDTATDQACGTGGMLSTAYSYLRHYNPTADVRLFGQEYNGVCREIKDGRRQEAGWKTI
jgi:hypothetical protein